MDHDCHEDPTLVELRACIDTALTGDELQSILAVRRARKLLVWLEAYAVDRARSEGWSWGRIAQYLGIAKQTLHRRHGGREPASPTPPKREAVTFEERARENDRHITELMGRIKARESSPPDAA